MDTHARMCHVKGSGLPRKGVYSIAPWHLKQHHFSWEVREAPRRKPLFSLSSGSENHISQGRLTFAEPISTLASFTPCNP